MLPLDVLVVVALAVYRVARIIPLDSIAHDVRVVLYRFAWSDVEQHPVIDDTGATTGWITRARAEPVPRGGAWRCYLNALCTCPICLGFWLAPAAYALVRWGGHVHATPGVGGALVAVLAIAGAACALQLALPAEDAD